LPGLGLSLGWSASLISVSIIYILLAGFIFAIICGYFSGLVGVSASPGSSVVIAGMIFAALLFHAMLLDNFKVLSADILLHGEAMTIIVGGIVTGIACLANDTMQDLKVGQLIKASPRKQQIMLLFGVLIASLVIPIVMQLLYQAYGFVGHASHVVNPDTALATPVAAIMAALTQGTFQGSVPWHEMAIGAGAMLGVLLVQIALKKCQFDLSLIGVGVGMYLPLSSSSALIVGSILALMLKLVLRHLESKQQALIQQKKLLLACGLVTGAALMDVLLAIPVALSQQGTFLSFHPESEIFFGFGVLAALVLLVMLTSRKSKS
jgi:putative OPT family oligopeptide transporter